MGRPRQVLTVTKGHAYDRDAFSEMLDALPGIECTQVEQPAAQRHFARSEPGHWDAYLLYDMPGYGFKADRSRPDLFEPPERFRSDFTRLVDRGHGFVFVHHALAAWPTWHEYGSIMGGPATHQRAQLGLRSGSRVLTVRRTLPGMTLPGMVLPG